MIIILEVMYGAFALFLHVRLPIISKIMLVVFYLLSVCLFTEYEMKVNVPYKLG